MLASVSSEQLETALHSASAELGDPPCTADDRARALTLLSVLPARAGGDLDAQAFVAAVEIAVDDIPAWALAAGTRDIIRYGTGPKRHKMRPTPAELREAAEEAISRAKLRLMRLMAEGERRAEAKAAAAREAAPKPTPEDWERLKASLAKSTAEMAVGDRREASDA